jgi:hypothetical protein
MRPTVTQDNEQGQRQVYWTSAGGYNSSMRARMPFLWLTMLSLLMVVLWSVPAVTSAGDELQIAVSKKGLGKEVVITQGAREWFMLVEVTPENTVIVRQEKERDQYVLDESETHDRPLAAVEVDAAINDYINSVKARAPKP